MNAPQKINAPIDYTLLKDGDGFRAPLKDIDPVPWGNVRSKRDPAAFNDLREAVKVANGVTQGVTVRIDPENPSRLQLIAGYGRVEVSKMEGYYDIPAVFKVADDKQAYCMMMSENLSRENLSIADEIIASQKFISYYNGDYEAAAADLNWSVKKLRGRLLLNQCTEKVREALRDGHILIGHAEILSAFVAKLQEGTLEKIISEKWSVEYLKERAGKANRWLKNAIFDIDGCSGCPHNSDVQAELFDNTVGKAKCNNLVCYREKTDTELARRKATLEEEYGVVLLAIEKPDTDRNTVNESIVGEAQFTGGCTGCVSNVVILKDGINADSGEVIKNQCIDTDCFRKMKNDFSNMQSVEKSLKNEKSEREGKNKVRDENAKPKKTVAEKQVTQTTPSGVIENNKILLRSLGAAHFKSNEHFMESICVSSLIEHAGFANKCNELFKDITTQEFSRSFNSRVMELYSLPVETLSRIKSACYAAYLSNSKQSSTDPRALVISALARDTNGRSIAIAGWKPTQENLNAYLKQGLIALAKTSGFDEHFDGVHGVNAFSKVANKAKSDLIGVLMETEFDWTDYAPDDYVNCLK